MNEKVRVGVLALQGDFGSTPSPREVRRRGGGGAQARRARRGRGSGHPGGESTTLLKLIDAWDFVPAIEKFHRAGKPLFGTCAGLIILAREVESPRQFSLGAHRRRGRAQRVRAPARVVRGARRGAARRRRHAHRDVLHQGAADSPRGPRRSGARRARGRAGHGAAGEHPGGDVSSRVTTDSTAIPPVLLRHGRSAAGSPRDLPRLLFEHRAPGRRPLRPGPGAGAPRHRERRGATPRRAVPVRSTTALKLRRSTG